MDADRMNWIGGVTRSPRSDLAAFRVGPPGVAGKAPRGRVSHLCHLRGFIGLFRACSASACFIRRMPVTRQELWQQEGERPLGVWPPFAVPNPGVASSSLAWRTFSRFDELVESERGSDRETRATPPYGSRLNWPSEVAASVTSINLYR